MGIEPCTFKFKMRCSRSVDHWGLYIIVANRGQIVRVWSWSVDYILYIYGHSIPNGDTHHGRTTWSGYSHIF